MSRSFFEVSGEFLVVGNPTLPRRPRNKPVEYGLVMVWWPGVGLHAFSSAQEGVDWRRGCLDRYGLSRPRENLGRGILDFGLGS